LVHAVQVLHGLGVRECNVRFVPCMYQYAFNEVLPCDIQIPDSDEGPAQLDGATLSVRLGVNVRDDTRLAWLYPLVAVGLPPRGMPREEVRRPGIPVPEVAEEKPLGVRVLEWFTEIFSQTLADDSSTWVNEAPSDRLARQLREQFPKLAGAGPAVDSSAFGRIRASDFVSDYQAGRVGSVQAGVPTGTSDGDSDVDLARELAEVFHTRAFLAVAAADLLGGFVFDHKVQPEGRATAVTIGSSSRIEDVAEWLNAYPHFPRELFLRQREDRQGFFDEAPEREVLYVRDPTVGWSTEEPAVQDLFARVQDEYGISPTEGTTANGAWARPTTARTDDVTPEEMVAWALAYVPDFLPSYPRQRSVTGGLTQNGILLGLINDWLDEGDFLGLSRADFERFDGSEQATLCVLLLWRRHVLDFASLFGAATRTLVHPDADVQVHQFVPLASRIGTPLAQMNKTMVLGGMSAFHSPEITVHVPCDRTGDAGADELEARLEILRRLFVPVHIPVRYQWGAGWVDLNPPEFQLDPLEAMRDLRGSTDGLVSSDLPWQTLEEQHDRRPA
jgi:hypothetical protein